MQGGNLPPDSLTQFANRKFPENVFKKFWEILDLAASGGMLKESFQKKFVYANKLRPRSLWF